MSRTVSNPGMVGAIPPQSRFKAKVSKRKAIKAKGFARAMRKGKKTAVAPEPYEY